MPEFPSNLFSFYGELGRPLTAIEIWKFLSRGGGAENFRDLVGMLDEAVKSGVLKEEEGFFSLQKFGLRAINRKKQDLLLDKKWKKIVRLSKWFNFLPFVDFAILNGSMALGTATPKSDFDVLIGVRAGRIFTARYLALFLFSLLGARRLDDSSESDPDKFCFNHFVTEKSFSKPPKNFYRRELYKTMIPIYGEKEKIIKFIKANEWSGLGEYALHNLRYKKRKAGRFKIFLENILGDKLGDLFEKLLKSVAIRRLSAYVRKQSGGRVAISDAELEFHFNLAGEKRFARFD
jgi:hypothetical protein